MIDAIRQQRLGATAFMLSVFLLTLACGPGDRAADETAAGGATGAEETATTEDVGEAPGEDTGEDLTFAVIPKGTTHEFWKSIHAGANKAAEELGIYEPLWKGPLKEDDREGQISVVESIIARGVDGIVLAPLDDTALVRPVENAVDQGIPVVIIDSDLQTDAYVSFVATDNRKGGYLGGQRLAELLGGQGRVIMLRYQEGSASTTNREEGFLEAMAEYPEMEIVSSNQYGGATTGTAQTASENLLAPYQNADGSLAVDGIFTPNESTTFGMLRALQTLGQAGEVYFVGFDSSDRLVDALSDGEIHGLVLQNPMKMGYEGVQTLYRYIQGADVPARIDTGVTVATPENMNEEEIMALLYPELEQWLE